METKKISKEHNTQKGRGLLCGHKGEGLRRYAPWWKLSLPALDEEEPDEVGVRGGRWGR